MRMMTIKKKPHCVLYITVFNEISAITMSELSAPIKSQLGPLYEIPETHCNIKRINSSQVNIECMSLHFTYMSAKCYL